MQRYDFLSTGLGAMCVTTYCVIKGQDAATAASITVMATIVALVSAEHASSALSYDYVVMQPSDAVLSVCRLPTSCCLALRTDAKSLHHGLAAGPYW